MEHKANPNLSSKLLWKNGIALHFGVEAKKISFIRLLLFFGADQTARNQFGQFKKTLTQADTYFAEKNYHDAVPLLLDKKIND